MISEQITEYNKGLEKLTNLKQAYINAREELYDEPIVFDKEMDYIRALLEHINKTLSILMSEIFYQVTCNGCGESFSWHEHDVTKGKVRRELHAGGWKTYCTLNKNPVLDYCEKCVENGNAEKRVTDMAS